MIAIEKHISTKLVLTLDAGQINGKKTTKRVTISGLREDVSADAILEAISMLEKLLEHPVDTIKIHTVSAIERVAENEENSTESAEAAVREAVGITSLLANDDATGMEDARPEGRATARAFGGMGKKRLLSRSCDDGYLQEPRLAVFRPGNNRALRTPLAAAGGAAVQYQTWPGCYDSFVADCRGGIESAKKRPPLICLFDTSCTVT